LVPANACRREARLPTHGPDPFALAPLVHASAAKMSVSGRPSEFRGMAALVAGAICIGFAPIWVRWSEVGPVATAFHRLAFALPVLALWALTETRGGQRDHGRRVSGGTLVAGVCFALDLGA